MANHEIILGLNPQPEEPKPFVWADAHNRIIEVIAVDELWTRTADASGSVLADEITLERCRNLDPRLSVIDDTASVRVAMAHTTPPNPGENA